MPDTLLYETDTDEARLAAADALRRAAALVERDVDASGTRPSLTGGDFHAAALLLTAEAFGALMEAAARYDAACDE